MEFVQKEVRQSHHAIYLNRSDLAGIPGIHTPGFNQILRFISI